jgi:hypothetical protein
MDPGAARGLLGAIPERSAACEELVTRVASSIEAYTDDIAERLVERIATEMELVRDDEDVREDLLAVARACASLLTSMTRTWSDPRIVPPPEEALEWARSLAARRLPIEALLRAFRLGQSGYREVWHRELAACEADRGLVLEALKATSAFTYTWVDAVLMPVAAAYEEERERSVRGAHAVRLETVQAILGGEPIDAGAAAARLGYELDRTHVAYVAWVEPDAGEAARDAIERVAAEIPATLAASAPRRALLLRVAPRVVHAWTHHGRVGPSEERGVRALVAGTEVRVALGRPAAGIEGFARSHAEARRARRVARLLDPAANAIRYEDVSVADLLTRDADAAREVARTVLGPLAEGDAGSRRLLDTLSVFLEEGQSFSRAARRLGVHENTVAYRVRRVLELTGQRDAGSLVLRAAVALAPLLATDVVDSTKTRSFASG